MTRIRPVLAGAVTDVALVLLGLTVPLGRALWAGVLALLVAGVCGGAVAGTLGSGGWRTDRALGAAAGALGGAVLGAALALGMNLVFYLPKHTAVWGIAYWLATSGVVTGDVVARHGRALTVGYAVALTVLYAAEGVLGAMAVPASERTSPQ